MRSISAASPGMALRRRLCATLLLAAAAHASGPVTADGRPRSVLQPQQAAAPFTASMRVPRTATKHGESASFRTIPGRSRGV